MNAEQADAILSALTVGYPKATLEDETLVAWADAIEDTGGDADRALEIARRWARTHEWFPTLAEFLAVITPHTYVQPVDDPDEMRVPPAVARQMGRLWRQALADVDARIAANPLPRGAAGHWHGGPDPCPLCRGRPPL